MSDCSCTLVFSRLEREMGPDLLVRALHSIPGSKPAWCLLLETTRPCHLAVKDLLKIGIVNLILTSTTPRPTTLFISFWFYAKLWKLHLPSINLQKKKRQCLVNKQNQIRNLAICLVVTNISKDDSSKMPKVIGLDEDTKSYAPS